MSFKHSKQYAKSVLKAALPVAWRRKAREYLVRFDTVQLHGPKKIELSSNEAAVTCVVKNGEFYLETFVEHYLEMGFRHVFFLDNGSTDHTISIAKRYENVSVCRSDLPIEGHQGFFKRHLAKSAVPNGWCLDVDVDELFDYPLSNRVPLREFLDYLNLRHYTAVITQTLDMFSDRSIAEMAVHGGADLKREYCYYDISNVRRASYKTDSYCKAHGSKNLLPSDSVEVYYGGIRKTLSGIDCLLTKHSLFVPSSRINLFPHVHFVDSARIADLTAVLRHYKFTANALEIAVQNKAGFVGLGNSYSAFIEYLQNHSRSSITGGSSVRFNTSLDLVKRNFLSMSEQYFDYANAIESSK